MNFYLIFLLIYAYSVDNVNGYCKYSDNVSEMACALGFYSQADVKLKPVPLEGRQQTMGADHACFLKHIPTWLHKQRNNIELKYFLCNNGDYGVYCDQPKANEKPKNRTAFYNIRQEVFEYFKFCTFSNRENCLELECFVSKASLDSLESTTSGNDRSTKNYSSSFKTTTREGSTSDNESTNNELAESATSKSSISTSRISAPFLGPNKSSQVPFEKSRISKKIDDDASSTETLSTPGAESTKRKPPKEYVPFGDNKIKSSSSIDQYLNSKKTSQAPLSEDPITVNLDTASMIKTISTLGKESTTREASNESRTTTEIEIKSNSSLNKAGLIQSKETIITERLNNDTVGETTYSLSQETANEYTDSEESELKSSTPTATNSDTNKTSKLPFTVSRITDKANYEKATSLAQDLRSQETTNEDMLSEVSEVKSNTLRKLQNSVMDDGTTGKLESGSGMKSLHPDSITRETTNKYTHSAFNKLKSSSNKISPLKRENRITENIGDKHESFVETASTLRSDSTLRETRNKYMLSEDIDVTSNKNRTSPNSAKENRITQELESGSGMKSLLPDSNTRETTNKYAHSISPVLTKKSSTTSRNALKESEITTNKSDETLIAKAYSLGPSSIEQGTMDEVEFSSLTAFNLNSNKSSKHLFTKSEISEELNNIKTDSSLSTGETMKNGTESEMKSNTKNSLPLQREGSKMTKKLGNGPLNGTVSSTSQERETTKESRHSAESEVKSNSHYSSKINSRKTSRLQLKGSKITKKLGRASLNESKGSLGPESATREEVGVKSNSSRARISNVSKILGITSKQSGITDLSISDKTPSVHIKPETRDEYAKLKSNLSSSLRQNLNKTKQLTLNKIQGRKSIKNTSLTLDSVVRETKKEYTSVEGTELNSNSASSSRENIAKASNFQIKESTTTEVSVNDLEEFTTSIMEMKTKSKKLTSAGSEGLESGSQRSNTSITSSVKNSSSASNETLEVQDKFKQLFSLKSISTPIFGRRGSYKKRRRTDGPSLLSKVDPSFAWLVVVVFAFLIIFIK